MEGGERVSFQSGRCSEYNKRRVGINMRERGKEEAESFVAHVYECSYPKCTKNSHYMIEKGGDFYPFCRKHGDKAKSYLEEE